MAEWQPLLQSIILGLICAYLLAKLISLALSSEDENLSLTRRRSSPPPLPEDAEPLIAPSRDVVDHVRSGLNDDVISRVSEQDSVLAEKGSVCSCGSDSSDDEDENWERIRSLILSARDDFYRFARDGHVDSLSACIDGGVPVDLKDSKGRTPLHWAVDGGHQDMIELLVRKNADVNAKDNEGRTPLHYAATFGREAIAEFLVKHNADISIEDSDGSTPANLCTSKWPCMSETSVEELAS